MGMQKAITALLSQLVIVGGYFGLDLTTMFPPELMGAIGVIVTTFLVWAIPNKA